MNKQIECGALTGHFRKTWLSQEVSHFSNSYISDIKHLHKQAMYVTVCIKKELQMNDTDIQWHPGFVAAMELELMEYSNNLYFQSEHNLSKKHYRKTF